LTIDNQEFELDVDEKQLKTITDKLAVSRNGYERAMQGFYVSARDEVFEVVRCNDGSEGTLYEVGNYYSDRQLAEDCAKADRLMRLLRRYSVEHRTKDLDDRNCTKWIIQCAPNKTLHAFNTSSKYAGAVAFDSCDTCEAAIKLFSTELAWYFTKFKDTTQKLYV
jgi:hypothetical protein